ncbi:MAG TPA: hypothetical protein VMW58_04480 [Anaerolineae bacterium]|nr:hypothetical protein [Anaerolineae bacterium]
MHKELGLRIRGQVRAGFSLVISSLVLSVLGGCIGVGDADVDVTFYSSEGWKASVTSSLTWQEVSRLGGQQYIEDYLAEDLGEQAERQDWEYSWRVEYPEGGGVSYIVSAEGKGLETLRGILGDQATIYAHESSGARRLVLHFSPVSPTPAGSYSLRVTGGKIISSNADIVDGNTAIWYDLSYGQTADAVLTEASTYGIGTLLVPLAGGAGCIGVLAVTAAGAILGVRALRGGTIGRPSRNVVYCIKCGHANKAGSRFCMKCAEPLSESSGES